MCIHLWIAAPSLQFYFFIFFIHFSSAFKSHISSNLQISSASARISYHYQSCHAIKKYIDESNTRNNQIFRASKLERIQKIIANNGICSRRKAEELIQQGKVEVNGQIVPEFGIKVHPEFDKIYVEGKRILIPQPNEYLWVMMNKPKGYIVTTNDVAGRRTVWDLNASLKENNMRPIGRLDRNMIGLQLFTNDVKWIHSLTHPSFTIRRGFMLLLDKALSSQEVDLVHSGEHVIEGNWKTPPYDIGVLDIDRRKKRTSIEIQLRVPRYDFIEKLLKVLDCGLVSMRRITFGPIILSKLKMGQSRPLTFNEIKLLKEEANNGAIRR